MNGSEAGVDLVFIQIFLLYYVFIKDNFHNKAKEVCIKTRSLSVSHSLEGSGTKSRTVKWFIKSTGIFRLRLHFVKNMQNFADCIYLKQQRLHSKNWAGNLQFPLTQWAFTLDCIGKCMGECSNSEGGDCLSDFLVCQFFLEVQWVFCPSYEVLLEYNVIWIGFTSFL